MAADSSSPAPTGDDIARCVLDAYDRLPQKCKPLMREPGSREWVPLSGIVLERAGSGSLECVALGTGMKCLQASKLSVAHGNVLHDSHAEVIAVRAFNRFVLDQCLVLAQDPGVLSKYVQRRRTNDIDKDFPQPFTIHEDISVHMYGSEAPCGDASMELIMAAQDDALPWDIPLQEADGPLKGRGSFAELGIVRRKPARADAPPTLSKSCTDKLTMYQFTSLLSSVTSLLVAPDQAYISTFTLPKSQHVEAAMARAFSISGRLCGVDDAEHGRYRFRPFKVQSTSLEFSWSQRAVLRQRAIASNVTAVHTPDFTETLINGILQGRKVSDPRGASRISRRKQWAQAFEVARFSNECEVKTALEGATYEALKDSTILEARRQMKERIKRQALAGWTKNIGDGQFSIDL